jgi:hypothetical protein
MNHLWNITLDDYMEVVRRSREAGLQPGDSMEAIFIDYMLEKGHKPCAGTELTKDELLADLTQKHGNILEISTDDKGQQSYRVTKKREEDNPLTP